MAESQLLNKHFVTLLYLLRAKEPCTQQQIYFNTHANLQDITELEAKESYQDYLNGLNELIAARYVQTLAPVSSDSDNLFELTVKGRSETNKIFG